MNQGPVIINYAQIIEDLMPLVVRKALSYAHNNHMPGGHYFYISFLTTHPKVKISENLLAKYPTKMTIVLQYQFENLVVEDDKFSISLFFNNTKEHLEIPYAALISFIDPSVKFGLSLNTSKMQANGENILDIKPKIKPKKASASKSSSNSAESQPNNVVSISDFMNKK